MAFSNWRKISGLGILILILVVALLLACLAASNDGSYQQHPLLMALLTISIATLGYVIARAWRFFVGCQMQSLLDPPLDLLGEMNKDNKEEVQQQETPTERTHPRLTKAQARAKLKRQKT